MTTQFSTRRKKHRFTVDEYRRMGEVGIFHEDDRVELINGEIIEMTPIGSSHVGCVNLLNKLLNERVSRDVIVSVQNPVQMGDHSEPEADVAVLRGREDGYASRIPRADDVLLLVEVADSTIADDRRDKVPVYAENRVPTVWLVNLGDEVVEIYDEPIDGEYRGHSVVRGDTPIEVDSLPGLSITPSEFIR